MLKNIYTPLSGSIAQERVMEIIANNLANTDTVGFKEETVTFKLLDPEPTKNYKEPLPPANYKIDLEKILPLRGNETAYVGVSGVTRNDNQGPVIQTGNPLDVMIEGEGMFAVMTREGVRYSRNGALTLNSDGALVNKHGQPILGERGDIFLRGNQIEINSHGEVYQDGELVDRILVFKFNESRELEKNGMNNYFFNGPVENRQRVKLPSIRQGSLEGSNVNAIKNLTNMILAHRSFEAYQKAIKNYDSMMDKTSNVIGDVRA